MIKHMENEKELSVMMYVHGFMSGANGAKQRQLQKRFKGRYRVIAPELDGDPDKSLAVINEVIKRERPAIIAGTSLGAWMTLMCDSRAARLVLVNPVTAPQEELAHWLDEPQNYFCKRLDGVQTYTLTREVLDKYGKYSLKRAIAYRGGNVFLLCSTKDELLGDRHLRTLQPYFSPDRITIVDDFGHQCRDAGLEHLFDILERVDRNCHIPHVPGQFVVLTEQQRAAAIARSSLLQEVMEEEGVSPEVEEVVKERGDSLKNNKKC